MSAHVSYPPCIEINLTPQGEHMDVLMRDWNLSPDRDCVSFSEWALWRFVELIRKDRGWAK